MTRTVTQIDVREELDIRELAMAQLLMDHYCLKIITGTSRKSMGIKDMAFTYFIPFATCYKKVAQLEAVGLIKEEGKALDKGGKKHAIYRSQLENLEVSYRGNNVEFKLELIGKVPKTLTVNLETGEIVSVD